MCCCLFYISLARLVLTNRKKRPKDSILLIVVVLFDLELYWLKRYSQLCIDQPNLDSSRTMLVMLNKGVGSFPVRPLPHRTAPLSPSLAKCFKFRGWKKNEKCIQVDVFFRRTGSVWQQLDFFSICCSQRIHICAAILFRDKKRETAASLPKQGNASVVSHTLSSLPPAVGTFAC